MTVADRLRTWFDGGLVANKPTAAMDELVIAVVEAAEKIADPRDYWDWVTGYAPECKRALAALNDALGGEQE